MVDAHPGRPVVRRGAVRPVRGARHHRRRASVLGWRGDGQGRPRHEARAVAAGRPAAPARRRDRPSTARRWATAPSCWRPGAATSRAHVAPARLPGGRHPDHDGQLLGFGYGYTSGARPVVARPGPPRSLRRDAAQAWLADCFEVVELHVRPARAGPRPRRPAAARAARHGRRRDRRCCPPRRPTSRRPGPGGSTAGSASSTCCATSTSPATSGPFAVLGRDLPLPRPAMTPACRLWLRGLGAAGPGPDLLSADRRRRPGRR